MKCAWCDREKGKRHALMSKTHPACDICFAVWYDRQPRTNKELIQISLSVKTIEELFKTRRETEVAK